MPVAGPAHRGPVLRRRDEDPGGGADRLRDEGRGPGRSLEPERILDGTVDMGAYEVSETSE